MKNKNFKDENAFTKKWFYVAVICGAVFALITTVIAIFRNINSKQQTKKIIQNNYIPTENIRRDIEKQISSSKNNDQKEQQSIKQDKKFDKKIENITKKANKTESKEETKNKEKTTETSKKEKTKETATKILDQEKENSKSQSSKNSKEEPAVAAGSFSKGIEKLKQLNFTLPLEGKNEIIRAHSNDQVVYWPVTNDWRTHDGIDILAKENEPVKAIADGKVTQVCALDKTGTICGGWLTINHGNGLNSIYKGLDKDNIKVKEGQQVKKGNVIALMGNTTDHNEEQNLKNHLHLGLYVEKKESASKKSNEKTDKENATTSIRQLDPEPYIIKKYTKP